MSFFAGIDYDSSSIDVVWLDAEYDVAGWTRYDLAPIRGLTQIERARRVRAALPARGSWKDAGVVAISIEDPKSQQFSAAVALARIQGAILACLPVEDVPVIPIPTSEWKRELGLKGNASKEQVRERVQAIWTNWEKTGARHQDAFDAFAVARAGRQLCERAAA